MFIVPKHLQTLRAIGHGILLALAMAGVVSLLGTALGTPISSKVLGDVFFFGSLIASSITVYFNTGALLLATK